jgi:ABC-2 type transport system ATP-binding protein
MADIEELCDRVIVIDHGAIVFDGRLDDVLDRFVDHKIVTLQSPDAARCPSEQLAQYGEVIEQTPDQVRLKIKRDSVIPACKALLDELAVTDIDIEEVPVEDVIRRLFAGQQPAPPDQAPPL